MKKIHIEIIGQGQPLVLVHGWGWHSGIWQPLVHTLQQQYQLFLVDLPGFGKSPVLTNNYSFDAIAELLLPHLPPTTAWLGWSLGGMFAWWLAIHYPAHVASLMTVASSPKFVADAHWPGVSPDTLESFFQSLHENYHQTLKDFLALQLRGSPHRENLLPELQQQLLNTSQTALPALLGSLRLLQKTDLRSELNKVTCPSLHIFGQNDVLIPTSIIPFINENAQKARCEIIKKAGHIPFLSQPDIFLEGVFRFF